MILPQSLRFLCLISIFIPIGMVFNATHPDLFSEFTSSFSQNSFQEIQPYSGEVVHSAPDKEEVIKISQTLIDSNTSGFSQTDISTPENKSLSNARLQELLATEETSVTDLTQTVNVETLLQYFDKTKDPKLINSIVTEMLENYQFVQAKQFIQSLNPTQKALLDAHLDIQIAFNSFQMSATTTVDTLQTLVGQYASSHAITAEELARYQGIIALMQGQYTLFTVYAQQFTTPEYRIFSENISRLKTQVEQPGDQPAYYLDALVAVELFNQGFFYPAKTLALRALSQNIRYILPYQVLAYSNFFTSSRDAAIDYFSTLKTLDEAQREKYTFLMGVAYYRNHSYEASVLHLNQIKKADDSTYYSDAQRYLLLDYLALHQTSKAIELRKNLLGQKDISPSDFFTYFDKVFFQPYAKGESYDFYQQDPALAKQYVLTCEQLFVENSVCAYGKIGLSLLENTNLDLESALLQLVEKYPQAYLYQLLGDLYRKQGKWDDAKFYLLKAMGMANDDAQAYQIKHLLQKTL